MLGRDSKSMKGAVGGSQCRKCLDRVANLTAWRELVLDDAMAAGLKSGEAVGNRRRYQAVARFLGDAQTLRNYDSVIVLRPDIWFRQPISAWNVSWTHDINVAHLECPAKLPRCRPAI